MHIEQRHRERGMRNKIERSDEMYELFYLFVARAFRFAILVLHLMARLMNII